MSIKTIDIKFYELCDEVDYWKEQAEYWEKEYNKMRKKYSDLLTDSVNHSNAMSAMVLKSFLSKDSKIKIKGGIVWK